jgi:hypothetical protein
MINAREARELVESSKVKMTARLDVIGKQIETAATLGERHIYLVDYTGQDKAFDVVCPSYHGPELTALQRLIKKELDRLGFGMIIEKYEAKVGGGLGSNEDSRTETAYRLKVSW